MLKYVLVLVVDVPTKIIIMFCATHVIAIKNGAFVRSKLWHKQID